MAGGQTHSLTKKTTHQPLATWQTLTNKGPKPGFVALPSLLSNMPER